MLPGVLSSQSLPVSSFHREQSFSSSTSSSSSSPFAYNFRSRRRFPTLHAVDKESQFEIDREKAREALQKLDEQLQTLSQQKITPKKRPPPTSSPLDAKLEREMMTGFRRKEMPELSESYLAYSAVALLALTFFYNVIFNVFIKPAVDGEDPAPSTFRREPSVSKLAVVQQPPPSL